MKRLIIALALFAFMGADVSAQGFLNRLKDKALQTVQGKVEQKVDQTVSEGMDSVMLVMQPPLQLHHLISSVVL